MPFTKRSVSPENVSQHRLPPNIRQNELECVSNGTLANLIRQLSSLSRHAEDIFGELYGAAVKIEHKTTTLFNRIDRLAVKVTQLDSKVEEVSLQDLHLRKPFKSSTLIDQQSLSRHTMPAAMADLHSRCDRPPDLDKLNQFRDDGKSGLKFYTDPDYFFALWREKTLKDADHVKKVHKAKASNEKRRKPRQSHEHRQRYYEKDIPRQPTEVCQTPDYQQIAIDETTAHQLANGRMQLYAQQQVGIMRPESLELQYGTSGYGSMDSTVSSQQQLRAQQQQRAASSVLAQQYAIINRNQQASATGAPNQLQQQQRRNGSMQQPESGGTTPTPIYEMDRLSPRSMESMESGQSRGIYGYSRPSQPPPAPPPPLSAVDGQRGQPRRDVMYSNGDLPNRFADLRLASRTAADGRDYNASTQAAFGHGLNSDRSGSPDLPPPPPPLNSTHMIYSNSGEFNEKPASPPPPVVIPASSSVISASTPYANDKRLQNGNASMQAQQAPPPPPPPPPLLKNNDDNSLISSNAPATIGTSKSTNNTNDARTLDARSDLLKAIKQGIQLKKVDRQEEKARDDAAVEKGHDVAAILKRRMEDVMGRSESEGSASDFEDDWDD